LYFSLGGALAVVFATMLGEKLKLEKDTKTSIEVFTYGGPQVGNDTFVKLFKNLPRVKCYQTINYSDIVPRLAHICDPDYSTTPMGKLSV